MGHLENFLKKILQKTDGTVMGQVQMCLYACLTFVKKCQANREKELYSVTYFCEQNAPAVFVQNIQVSRANILGSSLLPYA